MFNLSRGPARERLDSDEVDKLKATGALIIDDRRRRPLYFDGRFLAAGDLTREQNYFLTRQADLGRAGGYGVVSGLDVIQGTGVNTLRITPGQGITPLGELVVLPTALDLRLTNIPEIQRLDVAFSLMKIPREPTRTLSGIFIVALRAVEFSANPIAQYPTSITGDRSTEDGDIIEATAATLIPYADGRTSRELDQRRSDLAYEFFVGNAQRSLPQGVLPLAVVALNRGTVDWIDPYLIRREVGAEHGDILGLGFSPRAAREAHLLQYDHQLAEILQERGNAQQTTRFAASDYFRVLPPGGRMPKASLDVRDFTHTYFPPQVNVEVSVIPNDELSALLEESILLPPIDLTLGDEEQESTSLLILIPLSRSDIRALLNRLETLTRTLRPAAPGIIAQRKPIEILQGLRLPRRPLPPILEPENVVDAAWREAYNAAPELWYVRRRNLTYSADLEGEKVLIIRPEPPVDENPDQPPVDEPPVDENPDQPPVDDNPEPPAPDAELRDRLGRLGILDQYEKALSAMASRQATAEFNGLLDTATIARNEGVTRALVLEMSVVEKIDVARVRSATERYTQPDLGKGLAAIARAFPAIRETKVLDAFSMAGVVPELDLLARTKPKSKLLTAANMTTLAQLALDEQYQKVTDAVQKELDSIR